ncbi:MAG: tetratricopeptide repeat protein, partial [Armatimonadetes bacterium]|nr:tetratricopeptide repeat protein [Armatimonadota bacterium]
WFREYVEAEGLAGRDRALRWIRYGLERVGAKPLTPVGAVRRWRALLKEGRLEAAEAEALSALARAYHLLFESRLRQRSVNVRGACEALDEAREAAKGMADPRAGEHLRCLAGVARLAACGEPGDYETAPAHAAELAARVAPLRLPAVAADLGHVVGLMHRRSGRPEAAITELQAALEGHTLAGDPVGAARVEDTLGMAYLDLGNHAEANFRFQRSLVGKTIHGDRYGVAVTTGNLGRFHTQLEEWERAIDFLEEDLRMSRELGDEAGELTALLNLAEAATGQGLLPRAEQCLAEAQTRPVLIGDDVGQGRVLHAGAALALAEGSPGEALSLHRQARERLAVAPRASVSAALEMQLGMIEAARENYAAAREAFGVAIRSFLAANDPAKAALAQFECAMALVRQGRPEEAAPYLVEAMDGAQGLAAERMAERFREACERVGTETWLRTLLRVKQLNQQLAEEEALREALAGTIVHDLRSLVSVLGMRLDQALGAAAGSPVVHSLQSASDQCRLLLELASTILDAQKLEAGHLYAEPTTVRLRPMIRELVSWFGPAAKRGVILREASDSEDVAARADEASVRRVLVNLIHNATKYTLPREDLLPTLGHAGEIAVGARAEGERVRVWVRDTGVGIPPEFLGRIFGKFAQAEPGMKKASTGLGLYFCKLAIEAQGGEIGVDSEVDVGSTFWFTLPPG